MLSGIGVGLVLLAATPGVAQPPPECVVEDTLGRCLVIAVDPARPGRSEPERRAEPAEADGADGRDAMDDLNAVPRPPRPNYLVRPLGDGGWARNDTVVPDAADLLAAAPPAPAAPGVVPVDVLAQRAIEQLDLAPPAPRMSVEGMGFVGVPLWLWIDGGEAATGPVSATATAGAAEVTATARLSAVEWSMGPPGEVVRCSGPGTPWSGQDGSSPDCGYVYARRSLPERTDGSGVWPVTATAEWTVTWSGVSAGVQVDGEDTLLLTTETSLPVGEIQVLVGSGNR